MRISL